MCIEEVEKRSLDTKGIYWVGHPHDAEVLELQRRFESEQSFSISSTDNIHTVAMLLMHYLWDIPEPLLVLSSQDYRNYRQNRARYIENDYSVLRSKIRELHPVHRASLEAILRHLFLVASHSDKNAMSVKALAGQFCYTILRGNTVSEGGVHVKKLIMEDLIQNAHTLFDERTPPRVTSPYGSVLSPELSQSAETLKDGTETTTQEQVIPWARGTQAVETSLDGSPLEVVSLPPTPATEWWLPHPGLHQRPEAPTIPPIRPESALSSTSDFSLSAASLISGTEFPSSPAASFLSGTTGSPPSPAATLLSSMGTFSPTISERF
ncbi:Rho GTPase activation protein [Lactarius sanguifluus]|nr:Rho GTPase activation protein [Lactarius sanguifluus]